MRDISWAINSANREFQCRQRHLPLSASSGVPTLPRETRPIWVGCFSMEEVLKWSLCTRCHLPDTVVFDWMWSTRCVKSGVFLLLVLLVLLFFLLLPLLLLLILKLPLRLAFNLGKKEPKVVNYLTARHVPLLHNWRLSLSPPLSWHRRHLACRVVSLVFFPIVLRSIPCRS